MSHLRQIVLIRLLDTPEKGLTLSKVSKDLYPYLQHQKTLAETTLAVTGALSSLVSGELVIRESKGKTTYLRATNSGRTEALKLLGVQSLPPKTTWAVLKGVYLPALTLGLQLNSPEKLKKLKSAPGLRAAVMRDHYILPVPEMPTFKQSLDALLWEQIDIQTDRPFTMGALQKVLLNRALGTERALDVKQVKPLLAARAAGAVRSGVNDLRVAMLRNWIDEKKPEAPASTTVQTLQKETPDLTRFAQQVLESAQSCTAGRFGEDKVFVSHVYRRFVEQTGTSSLRMESFKNCLVEASQAGLLSLSRADLVQAMDPKDVAESETRYLNAVFHFVRTTPRGQS